MATLKPEVAIQAALAADSDIGSAVSTRIYAGYAPQGDAQPFIIVRRASTTVDYKITGPSALKTAQIDIWITGPNYETNTDIAELIESVMHSAVHRQTITVSSKSITFSKCFFQDQADEQEVIDDATGRPIRRIWQRWEVAYQNP